MELHDDTLSAGRRPTAVDPDLRDDLAPNARRRWAFVALVALDVIAIALFVGLVVVPRLT